MKHSKYSDLSDSELLNLYAESENLQWLGILLERYTLLLLGVCMKYMKDENDAKDCVQQIFLTVLTQVSKYKIDFFKSWLYIVAKNHCLMQLRQKGKATKALDQDLPIVEHPTDLKELLIQDKTDGFLESSLSELSEEQRQCVTLFYLKKFSYQEVSEKTGFEKMQVKSYIQNGKRNLKIIMERKLKSNH
ncbi:MAG: sigma-70 family RNA polymerase sigma factor [Flavisolibacter sp.]